MGVEEVDLCRENGSESGIESWDGIGIETEGSIIVISISLVRYA